LEWELQFPYPATGVCIAISGAYGMLAEIALELASGKTVIFFQEFMTLQTDRNSVQCQV